MVNEDLFRVAGKKVNLTKKASDEQVNSVDGSSKIRDLDINVCNMSAKTLNFRLTKFVMEVCKEDGECFPPQTLYSICCGIQRHVAECNGVNACTVLDKKANRCKDSNRHAVSIF
jgi:hypothetical protein